MRYYRYRSYESCRTETSTVAWVRMYNPNKYTIKKIVEFLEKWKSENKSEWSRTYDMANATVGFLTEAETYATADFPRIDRRTIDAVVELCDAEAESCMADFEQTSFYFEWSFAALDVGRLIVKNFIIRA